MFQLLGVGSHQTTNASYARGEQGSTHILTKLINLTQIRSRIKQTITEIKHNQNTPRFYSGWDNSIFTLPLDRGASAIIIRKIQITSMI